MIRMRLVPSRLTLILMTLLALALPCTGRMGSTESVWFRDPPY